jgi:hypothetical protein
MVDNDSPPIAIHEHCWCTHTIKTHKKLFFKNDTTLSVLKYLQALTKTIQFISHSKDILLLPLFLAPSHLGAKDNFGRGLHSLARIIARTGLFAIYTESVHQN